MAAPNTGNAKIVKAFTAIGDEKSRPKFVAPEGSNDPNRYVVNAAIAYELHVARTLASLADKRKKEAEAVAEEAGVTAGKDKVQIGTTEELYSDIWTSVSVQVTNPRVDIDPRALVTSLKVQGVDETIINIALKKAERESKPPCKLITSLRVPDTE